MDRSFQDFLAALAYVSTQMPEVPRRDVILTRLSFFVFRGLNEQLNQALAPFDLNGTALSALVILYASPGQCAHPSHLSYGVTSSRTNITRVVDDLVRKGWVERRACAGDRRKVHVALTERGIELLRNVLPLHWRQMQKFWSALTPGEASLLAELLEKVWHRIEDSEASA